MSEFAHLRSEARNFYGAEGERVLVQHLPLLSFPPTAPSLPTLATLGSLIGPFIENKLGAATTPITSFAAFLEGQGGAASVTTGIQKVECRMELEQAICQGAARVPLRRGGAGSCSRIS